MLILCVFFSSLSLLKKKKERKYRFTIAWILRDFSVKDRSDFFSFFSDIGRLRNPERVDRRRESLDYMPANRRMYNRVREFVLMYEVKVKVTVNFATRTKINVNVT